MTMPSLFVPLYKVQERSKGSQVSLEAASKGGSMEAIKKLLGMYLVGIAVVVAVWFIINSFFVDSFDVLNVWLVLDVLMLVGLVVALAFNYDRKRREDGSRNPGDAVSRRYLEVNLAFWLTAGLLILLLHNWLSLLALGSERSLGLGSDMGLNHQAWVIWAFVDTLLPLTVGATGCAMMRET